ncbi:unnamed protein product [marine sediment metagenome]|uniref:Uncharacterized protein n=1 Tax=marine sediment metagenome TaxID=412755 RepID=X1JE24_9ZZZZ
MKHGIMELDKIVDRLSGEAGELFNRFYSFEIYTGSQKITAEMEDWVKKRFGSVERVERQQIVSIKNKRGIKRH